MTVTFPHTVKDSYLKLHFGFRKDIRNQQMLMRTIQGTILSSLTFIWTNGQIEVDRINCKQN